MGRGMFLPSPQYAVSLNATSSAAQYSDSPFPTLQWVTWALFSSSSHVFCQMVCTSSLKQLTWASQLEPNMNEFSDGCHTPDRLQTFLLMVINAVILACLFLSSKAYNPSPQHCPRHWSSREKVQGLSSKSAARAPHIPRQPICHAFCSAFLPKQNCSREHGKEFSQEARHLVQYFGFQGPLIAPHQ